MGETKKYASNQGGGPELSSVKYLSVTKQNVQHFAKQFGIPDTAA